MKITYHTPSSQTVVASAVGLVKGDTGNLSPADLAAVQSARDAATGYASRAAAQAANVPVVVNTLRIGALAYRRDPDGTALTTADGQKWSPDGTITPQHFGAIADGSGDDRAAIQLAFDRAAIEAANRKEQQVVVDLMGREYAMSDTAYINGSIVVRNGFIRPTGSFPQGKFLLEGAGAFASQWSRVENVWLEGSRRANGIRTLSPDTTLVNVNARHFPDYGIRLSHRAFVYGGSVVEWEWGEPQRQVWAERTGAGISVEYADCIISGMTGATCRIPFLCTASLLQLTASHFWNGGAPDAPITADVAAFENAGVCTLNGNYFDNARLRFTNTFLNTLTGNIFQRNGDGVNRTAIFIESAATDETVDGLVVVGNSFNGGYADGIISFGGTGTYVSDERKLIHWTGNTRTNGGSVWKDHKARNRLTLSGAHAHYDVYENDTFTMHFRAGLRLRATYLGGTVFPITLAFGDVNAHEFRPNRFDFGLGLSSTGGPLLRLQSYGTNGFAFHPVDSAGAISATTSLAWSSATAAWQFLGGRVHLLPVPGQIYSDIRADRAIRFDADWDANHAGSQVIEFAFGGTVRHRALNTSIEIGHGYGSGGTGAAGRIDVATGGVLRITPSNGAGGFDPTKAIEWDGTRWSIRGGRVGMPSLPSAATGLTAGDVWVDTAAGNVLKVV